MHTHLRIKTWFLAVYCSSLPHLVSKWFNLNAVAWNKHLWTHSTPMRNSERNKILEWLSEEACFSQSQPTTNSLQKESDTYSKQFGACNARNITLINTDTRRARRRLSVYFWSFWCGIQQLKYEPYLVHQEAFKFRRQYPLCTQIRITTPEQQNYLE